MALDCTIPDVLIAQIEERFQHEKRDRVCLGFDEKQEFSRLFPKIVSIRRMKKARTIWMHMLLGSSRRGNFQTRSHS
jgi:hypothetical protein